MIRTDALGRLPETPSQTGGPYLHIGLTPRLAGLDAPWAPLDAPPAPEGVPGTRIRVEGLILDGLGEAVRDAVVELWQADSEGRYAHPSDPRPGRHPAFRGWGRSATDAETGLWAFETIKPGRVPGRPGHRPSAPHLNLWIAARGINLGLATRLYFGDEEAANTEDPVLGLVEPAARRRTLIARPEAGDGTPLYRLDLRLQGGEETVFLDV